MTTCGSASNRIAKSASRAEAYAALTATSNTPLPTSVALTAWLALRSSAYPQLKNTQMKTAITNAAANPATNLSGERVVTDGNSGTK